MLTNTFSGIVTSSSATKYSCPDPHPYAVIRLRTNSGQSQHSPSSDRNLQDSGGQYSKDFDDRPGLRNRSGYRDGIAHADPDGLLAQRVVRYPRRYLRDTAMSAANLPTLNGSMSYIEVDGKNLASWFGGKINTFVTTGQNTKDPAVAPNDFVFYVSDRRGNYAPSQTLTGGWPPLSYTKRESGEYGWTDNVNLNSSAGCPNQLWTRAKTSTT